ncbi:DUF3667 domain-containing protein [Muriicola sp. Z0-33]|uniref:DUF3667 domain-containing protein n=1 Tax=Muriicola sp. Z0-33 TaxID=2816957 RepID=UPI002A061A4B|nr:DUF3667 domain-containing protein [Muriicola sp. Z0-33]
MKILICKNCDFEFEGKFCPNCSQSQLANHRLNFKGVVSEFFDTIFNFEKGLGYTFWNLIKQPHFVAQSFIEGKRKRFTSPVKYFVISTIIQALFAYFTISSSIGFPSIEFSFLSAETNQNINYWNQLITFDYPILLGVINTLVWTVLLYILFKKTSYNFTELLVSSLYFYGTIFILINLITIAYKPLTKSFLPIELVSFIGFAYITFAYFGFFRSVHLFWRVIKIIIVFFGLFIFRMLIFPLILDGLFTIN